ncbi:hypothetical protein J437_LFUL019251 [Ladona fulva]|uniref:Uncharacterized protein n=1 Tax=Ladona fulva TaxID=123851 RepID=A0A8K0KQD0_LADFU|nr:hypothetical protein J437_LFUL019251 [Ladona fulva]
MIASVGDQFRSDPYGVNMNNLFVDFEACVDDAGKFVIKEVALLDYEKRLIQHWIVRPPFSNEYLGKKAKKQNVWLETYHHGLEKSIYISNLLHCKVIDLDSAGCPSLKKLRNFNTEAPRCFQKNHRVPKNNFSCALSNVHYLMYWFTKFDIQ